MGLFDLFKKKEKELCPLCGKPMGLFNSTALADQSSICDSCAKSLRATFPVEEVEVLDAFGNPVYMENGYRKTRMIDHLGTATLEEVKAAAAKNEEEKARIQSELGENFSATFSVMGDVFLIAPKALAVGIPRSKRLKNRIVAEGLVQSGRFGKDEQAILVHNGTQTPITVLEVHKKDVCDFDTVIAANTRSYAEAGETAWLILDLNDPVEQGDIIAKI